MSKVEYDTIPKYIWRSPTLKDGKYADPIERIFVIDGNHYKVTILPAQIEKKDGNFIHKFPGDREEVIEEALRKIVCEGNGLFLDGEAAAVFTLYQIQQELKITGHTLNISEIKEALEICASSVLKISRIDENEDEYTLISPMFQTLEAVLKVY